MDTKKWIVTAISVCVVGSLLAVSVTATNTVQQTQSPELTEWNIELNKGISLTDSEVTFNENAEDQTAVIQQNFSNTPGVGNGTFKFSINITDGSFKGQGSAIGWNGMSIGFSNRSGKGTGIFAGVRRDYQTNGLSFSNINGNDIETFPFNETYTVEIEADSKAGEITYTITNESNGQTTTQTVNYDTSVPYDRKIINRYDASDDNETISGYVNGFEIYGEEKDLSIKREVTGIVRDARGSPIEGANVTYSFNGSRNDSSTTLESGSYELSVSDNIYNVTVSKPGYLVTEREVNVSGDTSQDFVLVEEGDTFRFDVTNYLKHGESSKYSASYRRNGSGDWKNVSGSITVTSDDTDVLTVDQFDQTVTATSNLSVASVVNVTGSYKDAEVTRRVVVANGTVDNIDILPTTQKFTAVIGGGTDQNPTDRSYLAIFLATALASAVSLIATVTAGLAILPVVLFAAMIVGFVEIQVVIAGTLVCIFLGLNIGQNIDYGVR